MYYEKVEDNQPSLLNLFVMVVAFIVIAGYGFITLNTKDPLWFRTDFKETPSNIIVYCYGKPREISPDSADFSTLTNLINESLSGQKNWDNLSMSADTYSYYQTSNAMMALEVQYAEPIRVHSTYKYFSSVDTLVMPLDGRHAQTNAVFGQATGANGVTNTTAGSLHVQSTYELTRYLDTSGICSTAVSKK